MGHPHIVGEGCIEHADAATEKGAEGMPNGKTEEVFIGYSFLLMC